MKIGFAKNAFQLLNVVFKRDGGDLVVIVRQLEVSVCKVLVIFFAFVFRRSVQGWLLWH